MLGHDFWRGGAFAFFYPSHILFDEFQNCSIALTFTNIVHWLSGDGFSFLGGGGVQIAYELPAGTNWNFDVHWYPRIPGVISASSFDGKIGIYNIKVQIFLVVYFSFGKFSPDFV